MESNFNNRDFEQFVKQSADQYRMFPSEKVWKGVHTALHGRRRWYYGIALSLLLLTGGAVTWIMLTPAGQPDLPPVLTSRVNTPAVKTELPKANILNPSAARSTRAATLPFDIAADAGSDMYLPAGDLPASVPSDLVNMVNSEKPIEWNNTPTQVSRQVTGGNKVEVKTIDAKPTVQKETASAIPIQEAAEVNESLAASLPAEERKILVPDTYPMTIESVLNSYQRARKKFSLQVYFTPTISYRRLSENKEFLEAFSNSSAGSAQLTNGYNYIPDIDKVVTHKPDMGLNLGVAAGYELSQKLKLTGGLQFNVSRYDIKAYNYQAEEATIALNTGLIWNSVKATTNYRNTGGYSQNWLRNLYFSLSLPVGADLTLIGDQSRPVLGIAATVQPIYTLNNDAYLISADYKNYANVPSLISQWNIGTSFETYAGYSTGRIRWRVGPQVRYQLGSSFRKKYPVKEQLFDFGLKIGVMIK